MAALTTTTPETALENNPAAQALHIPTRVHVLIPAAGRGARYGTAENKVFALLAGQPVIARTVDAFLRCGAVDTVTVIGRGDELARIGGLLADLDQSDSLHLCSGGASRQESVSLGLASILARGAESSDIVVVHDAARPLVSQALIERCIRNAAENGTAIAAYPIVDTIKRVSPETLFIGETIPRDHLWAAQTPQSATLDSFRTAYERSAAFNFAATDEASLLEQAGITPSVVMGERGNIKITTQDDLAFAETLLASKESFSPPFRVGMGYDIHQLVPGRRLVLGGVEITHTHGLLGHSDADVVLHAICDALLGAGAFPDIGHIFPNDDPRYAGADSIGLLRAVHGLITEAGYGVGNVDACVIAEQPKISPHAPEMKRKIADVLQIGLDAVSIKATTNEKIGSLGAGDGIACHATALIYRTR